MSERKSIPYWLRITLCLLILGVEIILYKWILEPLGKPIVFLSATSEALTNQTGVQHYQQSTPVGNTVLSMLIWCVTLLVIIYSFNRVVKRS